MVLKFHRKAVYDVFNKACLYVAILFEGQFSGLGEFLIGFAKMRFERKTRFLDQRKAITGLDRFSEFPTLVDNVIGLGDCLRV